ncbi:hypothetical protein JD844_025550 [Phrynosoma platyrhinos]|uniref:Uncharacterized protein n=1 Tax=Phrynosoma platyrhinos TaxID=52577 RepID=A0ABQ7SZM6_PHRPL|nr:hypothetical protein JD844_025550 [Phrynosoma platyrhinos]
MEELLGACGLHHECSIELQPHSRPHSSLMEQVGCLGVHGRPPVTTEVAAHLLHQTVEGAHEAGQKLDASQPPNLPLPKISLGSPIGEDIGANHHQPPPVAPVDVSMDHHQSPATAVAPKAAVIQLSVPCPPQQKGDPASGGRRRNGAEEGRSPIREDRQTVGVGQLLIFEGEAMTEVKRQNFGECPDGRGTVEKFLLKSNAVKVEIISLGCTITALETKDRDGQFSDIVLGFDHLEGLADQGGHRRQHMLKVDQEVHFYGVNSPFPLNQLAAFWMLISTVLKTAS